MKHQQNKIAFAALAALTIGSNLKAYAVEPSVTIGDNKIKLEVAATEEAITRGLMYRTSMPENQGMVFLFHPQRAVKFWMYHTLIPLDMLFVKDGKIMKLCENVPPCKSTVPKDCPTYPEGPAVEVSEVIELNAGYASKHHIKEGDPVAYRLP